MSSVFSKYMEVFSAKRFKESVSTTANLYFTFGKVVPWTDENNPDQANTCVASAVEVWNNMIGAKKVTGNDIRHIIPRHNWAANTTYQAYDHMTDSHSLMNPDFPFYVVTDQWNVYKCLSNNYNSISTSKPTQTLTTSHFQTEDGYIWKYMYTLDSTEQTRFITDDYVPVKTLLSDDTSLQWQVQDLAVSGGLHVINVTDGGTGYINDNVSIVIKGDGTDANAIAIRDTTTNTIDSIVITNLGTDYSYATIDVVAANGYGAVARAIISPPGGHGSDPLEELGGSTLMLNVRIKNSETGVLSVQNDFRQIALIEDPLNYGTSNTASNTVVTQLATITLNGTSNDYQEDETVYQGASLATATFKGTVVEWDSENNTIYLSGIEGAPIGDLLIGEKSTAGRFLDSITYPSLQRLTGNLLYIDNIKSIERASDQTESFQVVLKF